VVIDSAQYVLIRVANTSDQVGVAEPLGDIPRNFFDSIVDAFLVLFSPSTSRIPVPSRYSYNQDTRVTILHPNCFAKLPLYHPRAKLG
jgi:hypothetical protein